MKKVVIYKAGAYERLKVETAPDLTVGPGEVKVEVKAAGVNYADCMVRMGLYRSAKKFVGWPITPGFEVSGHVSAVGAGVQAFKEGDEVLAVTLFNGYASQVVVPERQVRRIPAGLDFAAAAGFPAVYLTAWYALCELAHPRAGSKVLVHSAAGGVGSSLVQIAKTLGCEVVGVVGAPHKVEAAQGFGCDLVIDKSSEDLWSAAERYAPDGYDVICDANGIATLGDSYAHLRRAGKLVVYGFTTMIPKVGGRPNYLKLARDFLRTPRFNPLDMTNEGKSVLAFNLSYLFDRPDFLAESMEQLVGWLEDGSVHAPPTTTYPLEAVAQAHRDIESAKTVGKLILTFD